MSNHKARTWNYRGSKSLADETDHFMLWVVRGHENHTGWHLFLACTNPDETLIISCWLIQGNFFPPWNDLIKLLTHRIFGVVCFFLLMKPIFLIFLCIFYCFDWWCQKNKFKKIKKHYFHVFSRKNTLKDNCYHIFRHCIYLLSSMLLMLPTPWIFFFKYQSLVKWYMLLKYLGNNTVSTQL
jgi:hypothetical protein